MFQPSRYRPHHAAGFTLIELLVVISIIALLVGILLPALGRARKAAHTAVSLSNVRQQAIGLTIYADERKGAYPAVTHTGVFEETWMGNIDAYIAADSNVFRSPLDELDEPWIPDGVDQKYTSYGLNAVLDRQHPRFTYDTTPPADPWHFGAKAQDVSQPSNFAFIAELSEYEPDGVTPVPEFEDHFVPQLWGEMGSNDGDPFTPVTGDYPQSHPLDGTPEDPYDFTDDRDHNWSLADDEPANIGIRKASGDTGIYGHADGHALVAKLEELFEYQVGDVRPTINMFDPTFPN